MPWARGGFLGVDAFFVLSGFLITGLLLAERERTGRIALGEFWVRRARRLLRPCCSWSPWWCRRPGAAAARGAHRLRGDGLAALFYVANWRIILHGGDYFAQTAAPSPLEHTWSLGIEEQFYLVWPLLLAALLARTLSAAAGVRRCAGIPALRARRGGLQRCFWARCTTRRPRAGLLRHRHPWRQPAGRCRARGRARDPPADRSWPRGPSRCRRAGPHGARCARWPSRCCGSRGRGAAPTAARPGCTAAGWRLVAVAVAVVLAHVVLVPAAGRRGRCRSPPLVLVRPHLVRRLSVALAGVHRGERGSDRSTGVELFALRCVVTLGLAVLSYVLVERPIRAGSGSGAHRGVRRPAAGPSPPSPPGRRGGGVSPGRRGRAQGRVGPAGSDRCARDGIDESGRWRRTQPPSASARTTDARSAAPARAARASHHHPRPGA